MKNQIIPSIIANSQEELNGRIRKANSKIFQLDVMDGKFVKNKSLLFDFKAPKGKKYEAHLMVSDPWKWVRENSEKVDTIIFHVESTDDTGEMIKLIKSKKKKVGIAINPETSIKEVIPFLNKINVVLVMTANPGSYGSKFIPETLGNVRRFRKLKPRLNIEVDGGINDKTIISSLNAGANKFISGSYIQNSENPKKAFEDLNKIIK